VIVFTDGACAGNPGPGGWAAVVIEALAAVPGSRRVWLHSDSAYVVNCFRDGWWQRWERKGGSAPPGSRWRTGTCGSG
jgi:ribonuclease HI